MLAICVAVSTEHLKTILEMHRLVITDNSPLVSVVIPFHNTAEFLREAIDSVLSQTYKNFELILQDNASDDGGTEIAREMASRDPRIRFFRIDALLPQVANYNLALTRISADSEYCKIVQADDFMLADCLRRMVDVAEQSTRIGLVSSFWLEHLSVGGGGLPYTQWLFDGRAIARFHLLSEHFLFGSPSTVMYRSAVVRERQPHFYTEDRLHEDTEVCYEILRTWDFAFVHQILTYSRVRKGSLYDRMRPLNTQILDKLIVFRKYGQEFLSGMEFEVGWGKIEARYYQRLARAVLRARGSNYWQFQRKGLSTIGMKIEFGKLARATGREALMIVISPRQIIDLIRYWRARITGKRVPVHPQAREAETLITPRPCRNVGACTESSREATLHSSERAAPTTVTEVDEPPTVPIEHPKAGLGRIRARTQGRSH